MATKLELKKLIDSISQEEFLNFEVRRKFRPLKGQWYDGNEEYFVDSDGSCCYYRKNDKILKDNIHLYKVGISEEERNFIAKRNYDETAERLKIRIEKLFKIHKCYGDE